MTMTAFKDMAPAERDLLAGILYRAGVWIGQVEDVEGEDDDILEHRALRQIIETLASSRAPDDFLRDVARFTLERDEDWPRWAEDTFDILPDVARARDIAKRTLTKAESDRFCAAIYEVAAGVAEAFGEFTLDEEVPEGFLARIMTRIRDRIEGVESGAMNVSPAESTALEELESVLQGNGD